MYKMIIVDDKDDIIQGIRRIGKWAEYGVEIVGWAANGEEALKVVAETNPDLIITDIKMPIMDGIRLTELLKAEKPERKVIILSGYDDFSNAQQAVKLGAEEYLLKPIRIQELEASVKRVVEKLDIEAAKREAEAELQEKLEQSLPLLRDKFFQQILAEPNALSPDQLAQRLRFLQIEPEFTSGFGIIVIEVDQFQGIQDSCSYRMMENFKNLMNTFVRESDIIQKIRVFSDQKERLAVWVHVDRKIAQEGYKQELLAVSEMIKNYLSGKINGTISMGIGRYYFDMMQLSHAYLEAVEALTHKFYLGINQIIHIDDVSPKGLNFYYPMTAEKELLTAIKIGAADEAGKLLEMYFEQLDQYVSDYPRLVKKSLEGLVFSITRILMELNLDQAFGEDDFLSIVSQFDILEELKQWIRDLLQKIFEVYGMEKSRKACSKMERAKEYMKAHLADEISLNAVADYMCLSPTYFSALFKKYCNSSFMDYLTQIRIEKAKQLLAEGEYKVYEVANLVGYSDPRYFSEIFRKHTGVNPAQYLKK